MLTLTLIIALVCCALLGVFVLVRPKLYRSIRFWGTAVAALPTSYAFGVAFTRIVLHQDRRLFPDDLLLFTLLYVYLLGRLAGRLAGEEAGSAPAAVPAPVPAAPAAPPAPAEDDTPTEALEEKLAVLRKALSVKLEYVEGQRGWLAGIEENWQDLMDRFQNAGSPDERGSILETLGKTTEDRDRARAETRASERAVEKLERDIRVVEGTLARRKASPAGDRPAAPVEDPGPRPVEPRPRLDHSLRAIPPNT